ncbi:MAG: integrase [Candidatus Marinimicrobia bacterium]|nr:integrase [Candidatus Neomarinimicrobiota bacterium]
MMKIIMDDLRLTNINQIRSFLKGSQKCGLRLCTLTDKYKFIDRTIDRLGYHKLKRKEKRLVISYLKKLAGYKKAQLFRLINRASLGDLVRKKYQRKNPNIIYLPSDVKLLEETDELHLRLNSKATKEILRREHEVFHHQEYANISRVSSSHVNNLRKRVIYKNSWVNGTKAKESSIGKTAPPEANNRPGSIRIDSVSQRDVFHINAVDEITQWEIVICVPQISERFLSPALEILLDQFPFVVFNFHSDRGSEFINKVVAEILNKLLINQTKSRSRHCNDNALVESKNGTVVRKNMGYYHVNQKMVDEINRFYEGYFNPYLNFHRPCGFVTETRVDIKGRERKIYGQYTTPYEKLKEISKNLKENFLKPTQSFEKIDIIAYKYSDNEFAKILRIKQEKLFDLNLKMEKVTDLGSN